MDADPPRNAAVEARITAAPAFLLRKSGTVIPTPQPLASTSCGTAESLPVRFAIVTLPGR